MTKEQSINPESLLLNIIAYEALKVTNSGDGHITLSRGPVYVCIDIHNLTIYHIMHLQREIGYHKGKQGIDLSSLLNDNRSQLEGKDYKENLLGESKE